MRDAKTTYLPLSGKSAMGGNLNMGTSFITNVKDPLSTNSHYVAVNFVNTTVTKNNETISTLTEDLNSKAA